MLEADDSISKTLAEPVHVTGWQTTISGPQQILDHISQTVILRQLDPFLSALGEVYSLPTEQEASRGLLRPSGADYEPQVLPRLIRTCEMPGLVQDQGKP
jgi:hypothetical protein